MNYFFRLSLSIAIFCSLAACSKYQRYPLPLNKLKKIDQEFLNYYLVDAAHPTTRVWYMSDCKIGEQEISCYLTKLTEVEAAEISLITSRSDARASKNDILFYADPKFALGIQDTCTRKISTDQMQKIEVIELNHLKTYGTPLLSLTGFLGLLFLISEG